eukprot:TRINITY_DN5452_c0_g1_i1.p1 TRINITY_DN5452_c0_g1~~TRINITY_DN5452_c0_g1_i1.p1  ORF type:complete len:678 (+),score=161.81 TRINITY_DN5452_c0_g1_i1:125-2158(+)
MSTLSAVIDPVSAKCKALMTEERNRATFCPRKLTYVLYGGKEKVQRREEVAKIVQDDPIFRKERAFLSRPDRYARSAEKAMRLIEQAYQQGLNEEERTWFKQELDEILPTDLHFGMFLPTLFGQSSDEQRERWMPLAMTMQIIGCYAQTEMGHGSNVRALETTATYDKTTQEFVINSPTITSTKWWPGGLGNIATHCVAHCRLILDGKDFGVHTFLIQLRSLEDHQALPGVTVGDIGPKFGFTTADNGFCRFNNVRIPRDQLLSRYAQVNADGTYTKPPHEKIGYGTMIFIRAYLVYQTAQQLARASTIAIRYSAVRLQGFKSDESMDEKKVLDYQVQQHSLFRVLSTAYAYHFTGNFMMNMYNKFKNNVEKGDLGLLPEIHATSSGLKSLTTTECAKGIETCRRLCGGHGFSMASGLPQLFVDAVANVTLEGENTVMALQTARSLMKSIGIARKGGKLVGNTAYLQNPEQVLKTPCPIKTAADWFNPEAVLAVFGHRACRIVVEADDEIKAGLQQGLSQSDAWNQAMLTLVRASNAHCAYTVAANFVNAVADLKGDANADGSILAALKRLCDFYCLTSIEDQLGDFTESGFLQAQHVQWLKANIKGLLTEMRPDAIALVDGWNFSDFYLDSALGRYDGDVYRALWEWAQQEPMNKMKQPPGYDIAIKPLLNLHSRL